MLEESDLYKTFEQLCPTKEMAEPKESKEPIIE